MASEIAAVAIAAIAVMVGFFLTVLLVGGFAVGFAWGFGPNKRSLRAHEHEPSMWGIEMLMQWMPWMQGMPCTFSLPEASDLVTPRQLKEMIQKVLDILGDHAVEGSVPNRVTGLHHKVDGLREVVQELRKHVEAKKE
jgi:hypothetical protein